VWSVYIVQSERDGSLYVGITLDVEARVAAHNAGMGAKRTRGRGPWVLCWSKAVGARGEAQREEARIKKLRRAQKLAIFWCTLSYAGRRPLLRSLDREDHEDH